MALFEFQVDKFTFRVAGNCLYTPEGVWARREGERVRFGVSDVIQQRSGDVAFAEVRPEGTPLHAGDEAAVIETIKVNLSLPAPVTGRIALVNPDLEASPELINQDPYGRGWLGEIEPQDWAGDALRLLPADVYYRKARTEIEQEGRRG